MPISRLPSRSCQNNTVPLKRKRRSLTLTHNATRKKVVFSKDTKAGERKEGNKLEPGTKLTLKGKKKGKDKLVNEIICIKQTKYLPNPISIYIGTGPIGLDPDKVLAAIDRNENMFVLTDDSHLALVALLHTKQHKYPIDKVTNDFLSTLANVPNYK